MLVEPSPNLLVWTDGAFVPWAEATMHLSAHHHGFGVFEGARAYAAGGRRLVFRLRDHTARLFRSAHILKLPIPERFGPEVLNQVQIELLRKNDLFDAYLRPFVFYVGTAGLSPRTRGLTLRVAVMALGWSEAGAHGSSESAFRGLSLRTSSFTRSHPNSLLAKAKANANYMNGILALQEAQECGADDAILLDQEGFVTETSGANVFAVRRGVLLTPPLDCVLEGITRDTIIALAAEAGLSCVERRLSRDQLYGADEVFLTGTATEVTAVREVDGRRIGNGERGPITSKLQDIYAKVVRGHGGHDDWLTPI
jgi:branched-chain amino acid aminotransferase